MAEFDEERGEHDLKEEWEIIEEFPEYVISNYGEVANMKLGGRPLAVRPNQQGILRVGLVKDRVQYTRAVAPLVADAFIPKPEPHFNTPIHLDGDPWNCRADNLMWRPRAFAIRYHRQFRLASFHTNYRVPLVEIESGSVYDGVKEACVANGLYWYDVVKSYVEETFVPITYQEFRMLNA